MAEASIRLRVDSAQLMADVALLAHAVERSPQFGQLLLDRGDLAAQVRCVQIDLPAASGANECWARLGFSDAVAQLVLAVRAGDFDGMRVEC